jgi:RimJ/RimL family protein N-acetyltransferase
VGRPRSLTSGRAHPDVTLRAAREDDVSLIRTWRNDPDAIRFSVSGRPVSDAEHARWFAATLDDPYRRLWVAEEKDVAVGQVRIDLEGDGGIFSIAVAPTARGRGIAQEMLRLALAEIAQQRLAKMLTAVTHPDNLASIRAFERVGFRRRHRSDDGFVVLELSVV